MKKIIKIPTFSNSRGSLSVIEKLLNFSIKRVYFLHNLNLKKSRGKHKHKKNIQFLVCLNGKIQIDIKNKKENFYKKFTLSSPKKGILLLPEDWHEIIPKTKKAVVIVLASEYYSEKDYIRDF